MKNFTFAMKWHEILKSYSDEIRREVYDAVIEYVASGNIIEMQPVSRMAFDFIRYDIDERARRREARLAKKHEKESGVGDTPKNESKSDSQKATDRYYARFKAPSPAKVRIGSKTVDITARRIRSLAAITAEDLIKANRIPVDNPKFLNALDDLLTCRYEAVINEFERLSPSHQINEDIWTIIFSEARHQYSA